jgi:hypothetical protein
MTSVISATAVAQNQAFIAAIKDTQTCRDKSIQFSHRIGGGITISGYRSVKFSVLRSIFVEHGKKFKIVFEDTDRTDVRIDCTEVIETVKTERIGALGAGGVVDAIEDALDCQVKSKHSGGAVTSCTFNPGMLDYDTALSIYQHPMVLDLTIWPDKVVVDTITNSDNRGGLSYLAEHHPELLRVKPTWKRCSSRRTLKQKNTISAHAGKKGDNSANSSIKSFLRSWLS